MCSQAEFLKAHDSIKAYFRKAINEINEAIAQEEHERPVQAIACYERSMDFINDTFEIPVGLPNNLKEVEAEWEDACVMIQKLKTMKTEITYRLDVLKSKEPASVKPEASDSLDEVNLPNDILENPRFRVCRNTNQPPKSYREIINGLRHVIASQECDVSFVTLFQASVKVYKIQNNGTVTTVAGETLMTLAVCSVSGDCKFLDGTYFLQCSFDSGLNSQASPGCEDIHQMIWIYPLVPSVTTCYRTEYGAFIFPDLESSESEAVFGIIISDVSIESNAETHLELQSLTDLQLYFQHLLEAILAGDIVVISETPPTRPTRDTSQVVSKKIRTTANFISRNLIWGAEKTGDLIFKSTPYIISKLKPAPPDAPPVNSALQTTVDVAKNVSGVAAGVTYWIASKVGSATMTIGSYLAPHIQNQGAFLLQNGLGYDSEEAHRKMEGAFTIAAGAAEGFSSVCSGLETSAKILGNSLSSNSVKIIEHKYGSSAANVASGTFDTIGNAFHVSQNLNYITPKGIAGKMVKSTGKAVITDYKQKSKDDLHFVPAGVLNMDLTALKQMHLK